MFLYFLDFDFIFVKKVTICSFQLIFSACIVVILFQIIFVKSIDSFHYFIFLIFLSIQVILIIAFYNLVIHSTGCLSYSKVELSQKSYYHLAF
jgi:hypothetical protein